MSRKSQETSFARDRRKFTTEEVEILQQNPYTYTVTVNEIHFTAAFREYVWKRYQTGDSVLSIFRDAGYDPEMLGRSRLDGFLSKLRSDVKNGVGFIDGRRRKSRPRPSQTDYEGMPDKKAMRAMQHELAYLRQEVDFLKKIYALGDEKRRSE